MSGPATYKKIVQQQIEALGELAAREQEKRQALAEARLDLFEKCQHLCDAALRRVTDLDEKRRRAADGFDRAVLAPAERAALETLHSERRAAVERANQETEINRRLVTEVRDGLGEQIKHIKKGRRAIAGYGQGLKSPKRPSIISKDI